jgi:shikimate kinase
MADLFKTIGKTDFRELETKTIAKLKEGNAVISTGGGALLNPDNCEHLKQIGKLIYLKNDFDTLQSRNSQREQHGILANTANLKQNYLQRDSLYKQHADLTISCDNKTIKEIIQLITTGKQHG